jgi:hypothetical protein
LRLLPPEEPPERAPRTLYPGDVIEYYTQMFGVGDPRGLRQATIVRIDQEPDERYPVSLNTIEVLSLTSYVRPLHDRDGRTVTSGMLPLKEFGLVRGAFDAPRKEQALNAGLREAVSAAFAAVRRNMAAAALSVDGESGSSCDAVPDQEQEAERRPGDRAPADRTEGINTASQPPPVVHEPPNGEAAVDGEKLDHFVALPTAEQRRAKHHRGKDRLGVKRRSRKAGHQRLSAVTRDSVGVYHARSEATVSLKKYIQLHHVKEALKERCSKQREKHVVEQGVAPGVDRAAELPLIAHHEAGLEQVRESNNAAEIEPVADGSLVIDGGCLESPLFIDVASLDDKSDDRGRELPKFVDK